MDQIKAAAEADLRDLSPEDLRREMDRLITDAQYDLTNDEDLASVMAETNAFDWNIENVYLDNIWWEGDNCIASFSFTASGDQHDEKPHVGDSISGSAEAVVTEDRKVTFCSVKAELQYDDDDVQ